jgi:hypothetical protein
MEGDGTTGVQARLKEDAEERNRRAFPHEHLIKVLEDGQCEEGVGVKVRQHHAVHGQRGMEDERHG